MPFRTRLETAHLDRDTWELTRPLIWQGQWQYIVIREGFRTDFASIPKMVRWLLDNAGANAEAGVLHDAAWRESKRAAATRRIDPWFADGMLRRALRETGSTALTRTLIWFGVRIAATVSGRLGKRGPSRAVKLAQLAGAFALGAVTALVPTIVAGLGLVAFWGFNWVFSLFWFVVFERRTFKAGTANWPWPVGGKNTAAGLPTPAAAPSASLQAPTPTATQTSAAPTSPTLAEALLVIIPFRKDPYTKGAHEPSDNEVVAARELAAVLHDDPAKVTDEQIQRWAAMVQT